MSDNSRRTPHPLEEWYFTIVLAAVCAIFLLFGFYKQNRHCLEFSKVLEISAVKSSSATFILENGMTLQMYDPNLSVGDQICVKFRE